MASSSVVYGPPRRPDRSRGFLARHRRKLVVAGVLLGLPLALHLGVAVSTRIRPPPLAPITGEPSEVASVPGLRVLGPGYVRHRGKVLEVRLAGTPAQIGHQHARLLYGEMVADEGTLYQQFQKYVPFPPARWAIMDVARVEFRGVDLGMSSERRLEIAAQAQAFSPDPFDGFLPTYHRFVFLQSLYDIALSFEHSPLLGCTSFALTGDDSAQGHTILARNFDFEAGPVFDEGKAVFLVREEGKIPYASVAWPGLIGAMSGMNAEGVALVVHGGRARTPRSEGEPVVHTLREVLGRAKTTADALAILGGKDPMVSHMVLVADAAGDVAIAERAPGERMTVRRGTGRIPLTNHFEGPLGDDPRNRAIEATTSTLSRRHRLDEILANLPKGASVQEAVGVLRDRKAVGGGPLPLGDRRSIDALIATHAVVMDATARELWVSEGPHLVGRFVRFDLQRLLAPDYEPLAGDDLSTLGEDPIAADGSYDAWVKSGSPHPGGAQ